MRKSIGTQLFTYILIGTLISLISISAFFYSVLEQRAKAEIIGTLHTQAALVESKIKQVEQQGHDIASVTQGLYESKVRDRQVYRRYLLSMFEQRSSITTAIGVGQTPYGFTDESRWFWPYYLVNRSDNQALGTQLSNSHDEFRYWDLIEDNYHEQFYFLESLKGKNFWIEPYAWRGLTLTSFVGSVKSASGQVIGSVGIDISLDEFEKQIAHPVVANQGVFALLSDQGNLLAYPDDPEKAKALASYRDFPGLEALWPQMQAEPAGLLSERNMFWAYRRIPETNWLMIAAVPKAVVLGPVFQISALGTLGAISILAGITYLFIVRLKQRLDPIVEECRNLMANNSAHSLGLDEKQSETAIAPPLQSQLDELDEIGVLALSFSRMSQQLQTSIEDLNARVEERTLDLEQAKNEAETAKDLANAANEAKSEFLANMSHELRTPLNGILGYAQILDRSDSISTQERDGIRIIERSGQHLLGLINDILDLAKIESRKMDLSTTAFNFSGLVHSVSEICRIKAEQKQIDFEIIQTGSCPAGVITDEKRLRQVLINLLSNAIKFTHEGKVCFKIHTQRIEPELADETALYNIHFCIEDSGIGIGHDHLECIFQPFEQVKSIQAQSEGTGLGLAISHKMVSMMGGALKVKSELGKGSQFFFDLSLPESQAEQVKDSQRIQGKIIGYKGATKRFLVVDDRWENRAVLKSFLTSLGFEIIEAVNGEEGLAIALEQSFDLIITDIAMPVLDGLGMIEQLRRHTKTQSVPIFVSSASVFEADQQRSLDAGGSLFLPKPIQFPALLQALSDQLSLVWIYNSSRTAPPTGQQVSSPPENFALPQPSTLEHLLKLSRSGLINNLSLELEYIEAENPNLSAFSEQIRSLAKGFQLQQIQQQLQSYLSSEESLLSS